MNTQSKRYSCREEEIRATLTHKECIRRIKEEYHSEYDLTNETFDVWNQLLACEALSESEPITEYKQEQSNDNGSINGMYSGGCKQTIYFELTQNKQRVINELKQCNYQTSRIQLATLLTELFKEWISKSGHWLYIGQHWNPKAINSTINEIVKLHTSGRKTIYNPAALFTKLIKFHPKRKDL